MPEIVKRKHYENKQPTYVDHYTIAYRREDKGWFTLLAEKHPHDPFHKEESHLYKDLIEVCVHKGKEPRTFEAAEALAYFWMLGFSEYVRTGEFPKGKRTVNVGT